MNLVIRIVTSISLIWATLGTVGCASGGYQLTRKAAQFLNKQNIFIRVILYILVGGIVFPVTLVIDAVVFNTIDFWEGKVSQGTFQFSGENKDYYVQHSIDEKRASVAVVFR